MRRGSKAETNFSRFHDSARSYKIYIHKYGHVGWTRLRRTTLVAGTSPMRSAVNKIIRTSIYVDAYGRYNVPRSFLPSLGSLAYGVLSYPTLWDVSAFRGWARVSCRYIGSVFHTFCRAFLINTYTNVYLIYLPNLRHRCNRRHGVLACRITRQSIEGDGILF